MQQKMLPLLNKTYKKYKTFADIYVHIVKSLDCIALDTNTEPSHICKQMMLELYSDLT